MLERDDSTLAGWYITAQQSDTENIGIRAFDCVHHLRPLIRLRGFPPSM